MEQKQIKIPFVFVLRCVHTWLGRIMLCLPFLRNEDIIIATTEYAKNSFLKITKKYKVHVVPHPIDTHKLQM